MSTNKQQHHHRERKAREILCQAEKARLERERKAQEMLQQAEKDRVAKKQKVEEPIRDKLFFDPTQVGGQVCICLQFVSSTDTEENKTPMVRNKFGLETALNTESELLLAMSGHNIGSITYGRSRGNQICTLRSPEISKAAVKIETKQQLKLEMMLDMR